MSHHVGGVPFPIVIIVTLSCYSKKLVEKTCDSEKERKIDKECKIDTVQQRRKMKKFCWLKNSHNVALVVHSSLCC
jgi:hypothetical protein